MHKICQIKEIFRDTTNTYSISVCCESMPWLRIGITYISNLTDICIFISLSALLLHQPNVWYFLVLKYDCFIYMRYYKSCVDAIIWDRCFHHCFSRWGWYLLALTIHPEYLLWYLPPMNCCCFLAISNEWLLRHSSSAIRIKELSSRSIKRQEALLSYHLNNAWQIRPLYPQDSSLSNQYCHNVNQYMWIVDLIYRCDF